MHILAAIDSGILFICTKISHKLQRTVGITNYFIAKVGAGMVAINVAGSSLNYFHQFLQMKTPLLLLVFNVIVFMYMIEQTLHLAKAEDHLWLGKLVKPAELLQYLSRFWRLCWLAGTFADTLPLVVAILRHHFVFLSILDQGVLFSAGMFVFYYFVAVDPLPPGMSKLREFISTKQMKAAQQNA